MSARLLTSIVCLLLAGGCGEADVSSPAGSLGTEATAAKSAGTRDCSDEDYPGPWTACPEAEWVRSIAETSGYEIAGETGSALIAKGEGHSFYIWATRGRGSLGGGEDHPFCRIGGMNVWSGTRGMEDWRYWHAKGFTFWISAGPTSTATSPDSCDLGRIVHESEVQPPPKGE